MGPWKLPLSLIAAAGSIVVCNAQNPNRVYQLAEFKVAQLKCGSKTIRAWIADTSSKRQEGLMFLTAGEVPMGSAMLFVFPKEQPLQFWMKNTLIDLDIAYIDSNLKVVSTARMKAGSTEKSLSAVPAKFALEMRAGSFQKFGISKGKTISVPKTVKSRD